MLYVVILHALGQGGFLGAAELGSSQYKAGWFLETWALSAVNIFALISGYVGYSEKEKPFNYSNYLVLWLQVVAYGAVVTVLCNLIAPALATKQDMLDMFFPLTNKLYWYFTAYSGLFFLIPLINAAVRNCSNGYLRKIFILVFLLFSLLDRAYDLFVIASGYSFVWIALLYLLGAIIKKCEIGKRLPIWAAFAGIVLSCVISYSWFISGAMFDFYNIKIDDRFFISYISPANLCTAILYIIAFSKLRFGPAWQKLISFAAPGAFAVYILNCQQFIWLYVMSGNFACLTDKPVYTIVLHILAFSFGFLLISVLVDWVRRKVFELLRIPQLAVYITNSASKALGKLL